MVGLWAFLPDENRHDITWKTLSLQLTLKQLEVEGHRTPEQPKINKPSLTPQKLTCSHPSVSTGNRFQANLHPAPCPMDTQIRGCSSSLHKMQGTVHSVGRLHPWIPNRRSEMLFFSPQLVEPTYLKPRDMLGRLYIY